MDYTALSKTLSYALRHNPSEFGVALDPEGWTSLSELLHAISKKEAFAIVSASDICRVVETSAKKRFEVDIPNDRIRAYYGHSTEDKVVKQSATPPDILYHGTDSFAAQVICKKGLESMNRQYAHLSTDVRTAILTGKRKSTEPVVLVINAKEAAVHGIKFYIGNQDVWLADFIPPEYISLLKN